MSNVLRDLREAAYGLGSTAWKWRSGSSYPPRFRDHRGDPPRHRHAVGETMIVAVAAGSTPIHDGPLSPVQTMTGLCSGASETRSAVPLTTNRYSPSA
jgi:ABC-type phosphate transport system permease subunit